MTTKIDNTKQMTLAEAKAVTKVLTKARVMADSAWFDIGKIAERAIKGGVLRALGVNYQVWVEEWAGGIEGRTTAYDSLRIVRELAMLPEALVRAMPKGNALELTKLPKEKRSKEEWVKRATKQSKDDFKEAVRAERQGKKPPPEDWRTIAIRVPEAVAVLFDEAVEKIARVLNLDIEKNPHDKIDCWEAIANLINLTDEEVLKVEIKGGDDQIPEVPQEAYRSTYASGKKPVEEKVRLVGREGPVQ